MGGTMIHVDVVIISWARDAALLQITRDGLDTLFASSQGNVVFNAYVIETNREVSYEQWYSAIGPHSCETMHPVVEFGYHRYLNIGRHAGTSPYVVLCNSDLTYEPGWAEAIVAVMQARPEIVSVAPWCPEVLGSNADARDQVIPGFADHRGKAYIAGWCIFQQRSVYDVIGDLDERFRFWYCDNDYCFTLQRAGLAQALVCNAVVHHHENVVGKTATTLTPEQQHELTYAQRDVFRAKWQVVFYVP